MDLIFTNATVITLDPACPKAQTVVIRDGKVVAVGNRRLARERGKRDARVVDCGGKTLLPGFIDAHFHLLAFAKSLVTLNLEPRNHIHSLRDIQAKIRSVSQQLPAGAWIRGRGYHEFHLEEKRHPTRWDLDEAADGHPIALTHRSGGAHVLNSPALALMGITKESGDPPEGLIDRDLETGEPTGLLYGMGDDLAKRIPPVDQDQMEYGLRLANEQLCSAGITSIHDVSSLNDFERWETVRDWKRRGFIAPEIRMIFGWDGFNEYLKHPFPSPGDALDLRLGGVKIIIHETTGRLSPGREELRERVLRVHRAGFQAILHAVEERTVEAACDAVEYAVGRFPKPDHRHRIEHCSVCRSSLARRIASLGIMVVTQPPFVYYNGDRYLKTVPEPQLKQLYPFRTLMKEGIHVAGSSDCPIVSPNPMTGIYSATSRRTELAEALSPEEKILPEDALRMYTIEAARAGFEETAKGSIVPGKRADLVVLSHDPTRVPTDEIRGIKVEMTLINGEVVWEKGG